jgi:hypothetical protein
VAAGAGGEVVVAAGAAAVAARPGDVAAGARRYCSASLDIRCHGQVSHFPAALGRRAASRMLYCPRRKRTGAPLLVVARLHSRINGLADECVEHMLYLLDRASDGFSRLGPDFPVNADPQAVLLRGQRQSRR